MKKILITTGGTGGHVIPAKIIEDHLKKNFDIYYSIDSRGLRYFKLKTDKVIVVDTPKLSLSFYLPFRIIKVFYLVFQSIFFLRKKKINKIISIGGYMSLPVIIAAKILRLSIFLFEPNLVLGRGNKFFLSFSNKIFCYSKELNNFPKKFLNKIELINPLVSKDFYEFKKEKTKNDKFCFLISGGSQGAQIFDKLITETMFELAKNFSIKVIQQTSEKNMVNLKESYDIRNIENLIFSFEEKFINLINLADFCITRAGATSLAEISFLKKPFIAIPLPSSKDNHQMKNAQYYEEKGCCWVLDQRNLNKDKLSDIISKILREKTDFNDKKYNLNNLNNNNSWNNTNQKLNKIVNEN